MSQLTDSPVLPPHYYLDNFQFIIETVSTRYRDLLSETERNWLSAFSALPENARLLLVRLLTRKGDWFRCDKLHYPEIEGIDSAIDSLCQKGFITATEKPPFEVLTHLMTKSELLNLYSHLALKTSLRKPELVTAIATHPDEDIPPLLTRFLYIQHDVLPVFLLLFFGNSRQDLSQFVLNDLGIYRFEHVELRLEDRLFTTRDQITDWLFISSLADLYWEYTEAKEITSALKVSQLLPKKPEWPPLSRKWERLANRLARDFERQGDTEHATTLLLQSSLPPARERLARIAIKQSRFDEAANLVTNMLKTPYNEDEADVAARIARQLAKKIPLAAPPKQGEAFESHTLQLPLRQRVELDATVYYEQQGWQVWYCENSLLNALFGLLLWDVIFTPIPGAFLNPFQRAPRDMYSPEFSTSRKSLIEARFSAFKNGGFDLISVFEEKHGITNDWVNWNLVPKTLIQAALATITPQQIIACVKRILFDPKTNRAGHPDLFMVKGNDCQFVEVKGPGDKLQHHQVRWLNYLQAQNLHSATLYIKNSEQPPQ